MKAETQERRQHMWTRKLTFGAALAVMMTGTVLAQEAAPPPADVAAPYLEERFDNLKTGEPPATALWVAKGENLRALVVDAGTNPKDPFGGEKNKSLLLEDRDPKLDQRVLFKGKGPAPAAGVVRMRLLLTKGGVGGASDPACDIRTLCLGSAASESNPRQIGMWLTIGPTKDGGAITIWDAAQKRTPVDQKAPLDSPFTLTLQFNVKERVWTGKIDSTPLTAEGGAVKQFPLQEGLAGIDAVMLTAGWSSPISSRLFVDDLVIVGP
jgi:hypothetical protein